MNKGMWLKAGCAALLISGTISGCGGGANGPATPVTSSEPVVKVAVTTANIDGSLSAGDEIPFTLEGSVSATATPSGPIFLQARDPEGRVLGPAVDTASLSTPFSLKLLTASTLAAGTYAGTVEVRACKDAACASVYPGASATLGYNLKVAAVPEWETFQHDAAHRGYVPILLNPARFAKAWEWRRAADNDPIGGINSVVTSKGKVYVTKDVYSGEGILYALNEQDGTEAWRRSFGQVPALNPPAVSNGRVYATVTGSNQTYLWAFDAVNGSYLYKSAFEGQWPHFLAPTVYGDQVYNGGGYYGGYTYAFSTADGSRAWANSAGGVWDMYTPAVDGTYTYHHNGSALVLIDRKTGVTSATIADPAASYSSYGYHGAPVIGGRGNVFAFAGGALNGRASSNVEAYGERVISSFNIGSKSYEWSTQHPYTTAPAVADGVIYAASNDPMFLDAIDEATGQVLWRWTPAGNGDSSFHRNIVLTRNILFVSTDKAVYALDLATRTPVWSYPSPGMLTISADRTLYIATGATQSDGRLVAIKLK